MVERRVTGERVERVEVVVHVPQTAADILFGDREQAGELRRRGARADQPDQRSAEVDHVKRAVWIAGRHRALRAAPHVHCDVG